MKQSNDHFNKWCSVYEQDIQRLWSIFSIHMNERIGVPIKCNYEEFVDFVYEHSSGYISEYA